MDLLAVGELLIDFTPKQFENQKGFVPHPGGAPSNMLAMAQVMGLQTGFIGKVGQDQFGLQLKDTLEKAGIDTRNLVLSKEFNTTLAFVHLTDDGERSFSFYRKGCADVQLEMEEIDWELLESAKALHFGSLSFTDEPSHTTVLELLKKAKAMNKWISYDPNYRPALWSDKEKAVEKMLMGLSYADIIKVSDEEALLLTSEETIEKAAVKLHGYGPKLICVTLGENGVYYHHRDFKGYVKGFEAKVIDTTGAGDGFFGAFMAQMIQNKMEMNEASIIKFLNIANAAASLVVEGYGGIPSMPTLDKVMARANNSLK